MARPIVVLHHLEVPVLGYARDALTSRGAVLVEVDVRRGEALPDLGDAGGIVSMGGEQSVRDIASMPELGAEIALLREAVAREVPVLGVCLGSQLLAHALGGEVRRMDERMIGWYEVTPLAAASEDPLFGALPGPARILHWNEDCFSLRDGEVELLSRPGPGVEAFRAGRCAWAVQCHPEADAAVLDQWYSEEPECDTPGARAADARHLAAQRATAAAIFGGFAGVVAGR